MSALLHQIIKILISSRFDNLNEVCENLDSDILILWLCDGVNKATCEHS